MKRSLISLAIGAIALGTVSLPSFAQVSLTEESQVATNGIGPVLVGQTISEASRAGGLRMKIGYGDPQTCAYFRPQGGLDGVNFMVTRNRVARVDITNPRVMTLRGAKVGDTEERIKSLYPGQIRVEPHPYGGRRGGHYLIFVPKDLEDSNYRIIFETDGQRVSRYRAGKLPEVNFIEDCS
jgi:hypothetical protein